MGNHAAFRRPGAPDRLRRWWWSKSRPFRVDTVFVGVAGLAFLLVAAVSTVSRSGPTRTTELSVDAGRRPAPTTPLVPAPTTGPGVAALPATPSPAPLAPGPSASSPTAPPVAPRLATGSSSVPAGTVVAPAAGSGPPPLTTAPTPSAPPTAAPVTAAPVTTADPAGTTAGSASAAVPAGTGPSTTVTVTTTSTVPAVTTTAAPPPSTTSTTSAPLLTLLPLPLLSGPRS